ncbi:GntR family transcriptional regulator [Embleya hyalina]|nr:winged helix-turn-helix domain-containing protein [Embleya hyalina]
MRTPADDPRPPYLQAADDLEAKILSGDLKAGDQLPSGTQLQQEYGISNGTVQSALKRLKDKGFVYSVQGRGNFVRDRAAEAADDEARSASQPSSPEFAAIMRQLESLGDGMQALADRVTQLESQAGQGQQAG